MQSIQVKSQQSTLDIAIQTTGTAETAMEIAAINNISISDVLISGTNLITVKPVYKSIVRLYADEGRVPATAETKESQQGIAYWQIGDDFIVQ